MVGCGTTGRFEVLFIAGIDRATAGAVRCLHDASAMVPDMFPPVLLPVEGMSCAACSARVQRALQKLPGVYTASVNLATRQASVQWVNAAQADVPAAVAAIVAAGYSVPALTHTLRVRDMSCAACSARVQRLLEKTPGVQSAHVNLATAQAHITAEPQLDARALAAAVAAAGYPAELLDSAAHADAAATLAAEEAAAAHEHSRLRRDAVLAACLSLPVFAVEMGGHLVPALHHALHAALGGPQALWMLQALLSTLVLVLPGRRFFVAGGRALLRAAPDMNTLVALGAGAAWLYSLCVTFAPQWLPQGTQGNVYYESAVVIVTLILVGRLLEARARGQTSQAIAALLRMQPVTARVVQDDGSVQELPVAHVAPGSVLDIRPGERIALDATVTHGSSHVDESMLSGEPVPVEKTAGSALMAGTVNGHGALRASVTRVAADSTLAQIVRMVRQAQGARLPIQAVVDRVTLWFVPVVMLLALLTFVLWWVIGGVVDVALVNAVAVLIIACPCAMGLATPTSIMVGTGRAAQLGILLRRGDALQQLQATRVVAVDKTGTLTLGRPVLTDFIALAQPVRADAAVIRAETGTGADSDVVPVTAATPPVQLSKASPQQACALLRVLAAVEARSEHPIARAIAQAGEDPAATLAALSPAEAASEVDDGCTAGDVASSITVHSFETRPGYGVTAHVSAPGLTLAGVESGAETVTPWRIDIGADRYMRQLGIDPAPFAANARALGHEGRTPMYAAVDGRLAALLAVADPIRPEAASAIAALHAQGIKVAMITGDNRRTANAVAWQLDIEEIVSEALPADKAEAVRNLRATHGSLAYVGDGINDAPALASADVGIALSTGTDIAMEAADVVLMHRSPNPGQATSRPGAASSGLHGIAQAIALSRATLGNIRQNLFWAFAYNAALIPVAAGALYPVSGTLLSPMLAAGAMALSSVFVVTNALRLRQWTPEPVPVPAPGASSPSVAHNGGKAQGRKRIKRAKTQ